LLDDGTLKNPLEKYNFGERPELLFKKCFKNNNENKTSDEKKNSEATNINNKEYNDLLNDYEHILIKLK
jgi:hypothetical protein